MGDNNGTGLVGQSVRLTNGKIVPLRANDIVMGTVRGSCSHPGTVFYRQTLEISASNLVFSHNDFPYNLQWGQLADEKRQEEISKIRASTNGRQFVEKVENLPYRFEQFAEIPVAKISQALKDMFKKVVSRIPEARRLRPPNQPRVEPSAENQMDNLFNRIRWAQSRIHNVNVMLSDKEKARMDEDLDREMELSHQLLDLVGQETKAENFKVLDGLCHRFLTEEISFLQRMRGGVNLLQSQLRQGMESIQNDSILSSCPSCPFKCLSFPKKNNVWTFDTHHIVQIHGLDYDFESLCPNCNRTNNMNNGGGGGLFGRGAGNGNYDYRGDGSGGGNHFGQAPGNAGGGSAGGFYPAGSHGGHGYGLQRSSEPDRQPSGSQYIPSMIFSTSKEPEPEPAGSSPPQRAAVPADPGTTFSVDNTSSQAAKTVNPDNNEEDQDSDSREWQHVTESDLKADELKTAPAADDGSLEDKLRNLEIEVKKHKKSKPRTPSSPPAIDESSSGVGFVHRDLPDVGPRSEDPQKDPKQSSVISSLKHELRKERGSTESVAKLLISHMQTHRAEVEVQHFCLSKIWDLCKDTESSQVRTIFMSTTTTQEIQTAMETHKQSATIQETACGVLWCLSTVPKDRIEVVKQGVIENISKALVNHEKNHHVVKMVLGTLRVLSPQAEARSQMDDLFIKQQVCEVMAIHSSDGAILRDGCYLLGNAAVAGRETKEVSGMYEFEVNAVINAMVSMQGSVDVFSGGCFALKNYTWAPDNLRLIAEEDNIMTLLRQAQKLDDPTCKKNADIVIRRIEDYTCSRIVDSNDTSDIITAVKRSGDSQDVFLCGVQALVNFAGSSHGARDLIEAEFLGELLKGMDLFVDIYRIQIVGFHLMEVMAAHSAGSRRKIIQAGGCVTLVEAFRRYGNDVSAKIRVSRVFKELSVEYDCWFELEKTYMGHGGAGSIASEILNMPPSHPDIEQNVMSMLENFTKHMDS